MASTTASLGCREEDGGEKPGVPLIPCGVTHGCDIFQALPITPVKSDTHAVSLRSQELPPVWLVLESVGLRWSQDPGCWKAAVSSLLCGNRVIVRVQVILWIS